MSIEYFLIYHLMANFDKLKTSLISNHWRKEE